MSQQKAKGFNFINLQLVLQLLLDWTLLKGGDENADLC
jgi:hypothetical protein